MMRPKPKDAAGSLGLAEANLELIRGRYFGDSFAKQENGGFSKRFYLPLEEKAPR
jgi:hypothetical protein